LDLLFLSKGTLPERLSYLSMPIRCCIDSLDLSILIPSFWLVSLQVVLATPDPVHEATDQTRVAASRGDLSAAIEAQERGVPHLRSIAAEDRHTLLRLSVILHNLAGYCSQAGRWHDAQAPRSGHSRPAA
jgi:hypothetical protein